MGARLDRREHRLQSISNPNRKLDWFLSNRAPTLVVVFGMALVIGGDIIAIHKKSHDSEAAAVGDNATES